MKKLIVAVGVIAVLLATTSLSAANVARPMAACRLITGGSLSMTPAATPGWRVQTCVFDKTTKTGVIVRQVGFTTVKPPPVVQPPEAMCAAPRRLEMWPGMHRP